ncbi:adenylate/guanylate cyclase domain-containing protein, partial [Ramlibacter sp.]
MPVSPVSAIDSVQDGRLRAPLPQAEDGDLFQAAVLFTDMRGSSDLVNRVPPREFFRLLNGSLCGQAAAIDAHGGTVVKYTGDGLLAVFRGPARAALALRCALALAAAGGREPRLPVGVGVADGPVLAGLLGPDTPG